MINKIISLVLAIIVLFSPAPIPQERQKRQNI